MCYVVGRVFGGRKQRQLRLLDAVWRAVLEDLVRGFDPDGVGNREHPQQGDAELEQRRRADVLVVRSKGRYDLDDHVPEN